MTVAVAPVGLTRDRWHRYGFSDGTQSFGPFPGATSILKLQDALMGGDLGDWGGREAMAAYEAARILGDPHQKAKETALDAPHRARDLGTDIHTALELIVAGRAAEAPITARPLVPQIAAFLAAERPHFLYVEQGVMNLRVGYGGTFDFVGVIRGRIALVDLKSGKPKTSHRLQLAAYAAAEFMGNPGDPEPHDMPRIKDYYLLYVTEAGYDLQQVPVDRADRAHFFELAKAYHRAKAWQRLREGL